MILRRSTAGVLLACLAATGCGADSVPTASPPVAVAGSVTIKDRAYTPADLHVNLKTTVTFTNGDAVKHTVTASPGSPAGFDPGMLATGKTFTLTFSKPGTYSYHCTVHKEMKGRVTVAS